MLQIRFEVGRDADAAYAFVADGYFQNHRRWDKGLADLVDLGSGPMAPGRRGREVRRFLGEQTTEFEVVAAEPGRRLVLRDEPGVWSLTRTYAFEPRAGGSTVTFLFDMAPRAAWFRVVHPLARLAIAAQVRRNMGRLQALLEAPGPTAERA